jgi:hypothetical protein
VLPSAPGAFPPVLRDPTDVIGRRFAAWVIDWGIALVMFVALAVSLAESNEYLTSSQAVDECDFINDFTDEFCVPVENSAYVYQGGDIALIFLLPALYTFLNDGLLTGVTGFSIGKGVVGLRVVRQSDGRLAGVGRCLLRWLLWAADWAPYCFPLVGLITALVAKGHRRVGDMAAGTLVVDKHDVGVVPVVPGMNAPAAMWAPSPPAWGAPPGYGQPPYGPPGYGQPQPPYGQPQPPYGGPPQPWGAPPQPWGAPPPPQPPTWGAPPPPQAPPPTDTAPTWGAPVPPPPAAPAPAPTPGVDGPVWDDARDTYIQWDPDLQAWVQWDDAAKEWRTI